MTQRVFITGISSGLGRACAEEYLTRGWEVRGLSRRASAVSHPALRETRCDLADFEHLSARLDALLGDSSRIDLIILNAGILGEIRDLADTSLEAIHQVMDINVWANKLILDWFINRRTSIDQIVLISSGAAVNGHRGWGAYALSKATLNMLAQLYAHEMPDAHLCALAPGLVDTAMQDYLCDKVKIDAQRFASVKRLRAARGTDAMPGPREAARWLADLIPKLKRYPSGGFQYARSL